MSDEVKIIIEEIKELINTTSRMDERVKIIVESQNAMSNKLQECMESYSILSTRMQVTDVDVAVFHDKILKMKSKLEVIESYRLGKIVNTITEFKSVLDKLHDRLQVIELERRAWGHRFSTVISYIWQGTYIICICYLLYKLGLNNPPIP